MYLGKKVRMLRSDVLNGLFLRSAGLHQGITALGGAPFRRKKTNGARCSHVD